MTFTDDLRPDERAPALAPAGVAFLDARNGFLVTTGGGQEIPKVGWRRPRAPARVERTTDAGLTWRAVWSGPGIVLSGLSFASDRRHANATGMRSPMTDGYGPMPTSDVRLSSNDGGRTWRLGGPALVDSPLRGRSGRTVYEVTGPQSVTRIRRSDDGGRTWRTVLDLHGRRRWVSIVRLGVVDPLHVWAVSHESNQGFDWFDVHVTDDGGRHWSRRRVPALPSAFEAGGRAWAVDGANAAVWRTLDEGRTWRISTSPLGVGVYAVDVATRGEIDVATTIGELRSTDGGHTWRSVARVTERVAARRNGRLAFVPAVGGYSERVLVRRGDAWAALRPPPRLFTFGDASFTDRDHGLVAAGDASAADIRADAYRTVDGGRTWTVVRLPPGTSRQDPAALGPDTLVVEQSGRLLVSVDDGGHWREFHVPLQFPECVVQRPETVTWILCSDIVSEHASTRSVLLRTTGGSSWRVLTTGAPLAQSFRATSDSEAWTGGWTNDPGSVAPLWHTTDGGSTWKRVAAAPPRDAPVVSRLPLPR